MVFAQSDIVAASTNNAASEPVKGTGTDRIRTILADSQAVYRIGTRNILALEDDIRLILQVDTLAGLKTALQRFPADVMLLDNNLISGAVDVIADLVRLAPQLKIIVQSPPNDEVATIELYRLGVQGIVPRSISPDLLVKCVRRIAAGETWIDNQSISRVIAAYRSEAIALTVPSHKASRPQRVGDRQLHHAGHAKQGDL